MLIETPRLILRPLVESDLDDLFEYQSDPDTVRYIPWPPRTFEQVREAFLKYHALPDFSHDGDTALLGWELKENGKVIGQSNFTLESIVSERGSIGYVVNPEYARRGYTSEASGALVSHIFNRLKVRRLVATIDPRNHGSIKVAEGLGFRHEVTFIQDECIKNEWVDTSIYALRRDEWREYVQKSGLS